MRQEADAQMCERSGDDPKCQCECCAMTENGALASIYRVLTNRLHTLRRKGLLQGGGFAVSNHEHRAIVEALAARDPASASKALKTHVRAGRSRFANLLSEADAA